MSADTEEIFNKKTETMIWLDFDGQYDPTLKIQQQVDLMYTAMSKNSCRLDGFIVSLSYVCQL